MMIYSSSLPALDIPEVDLFSLFFDQERYSRDKIIFQATDVAHRSYTWFQLRYLSIRFASALAKNATFQIHSRVAIVSPNDIDIIPVLLGTWLAGGAATTVNPSYTVHEIRHQLEDSGASLIVTHHSVLTNVLEAAAELKIATTNTLLLGNGGDASIRLEHWQHLASAISDEKSEAFQPPSIDPKTTPAFLPYSSGTTGLPKGVILTHFNLCANVLQLNQRFQHYISWQGGPRNTITGVAAAEPYDTRLNTGGDRVLSVLPVFHVYGNVLELLIPLWMGTTSYVSPRFSTTNFASDIQRFGITQLFVVPPMLLWLAQTADRLEETLGRGWASTVRVCVCGAAPLAPELIERIRKRLGWNIVQGYGTSETSPCLAIQDPSDSIDGAGSVGTLLSRIEAKVVKLSEDEQEGTEAQNEGEVVVRGPNVFLGYLNREEETKISLDEHGWFRTGDVGYIEQHSGRLYLMDRIKDIIKVHGFQVAPAELEAVLLQCSVVSDAAVVGVRHTEDHTEVPRAYCVPKGGIDKANEADKELVQRWVEARLAKHKWLKGGIVWVEAIPKSPTGKILRRLLKVLESPAQNGTRNGHVI